MRPPEGGRYEGNDIDATPVRGRRMAEMEPSMFAGHSVLCPYDCKDKGANREIGVPRLMRGARPGLPRAADSGSPSRLPSCVRASRVNKLPHST